MASVVLYENDTEATFYVVFSFHVLKHASTWFKACMTVNVNQSQMFRLQSPLKNKTSADGLSLYNIEGKESHHRCGAWR